MSNLAPTFDVTCVEDLKEVHYSASGLWTLEKMPELQSALFEASKSFIEKSRSFCVLGDLRGFAVQPRDVVDQMEQIQLASAKLGVRRMALVCSSIMVKRQFRRVSEAVNMDLFDTKNDAIAWLRSYA
jgi:hypothetical protein